MGSYAGFYGSMTIAEDKKEQFNKHISRILDIGGMMDVELVRMYGQTVPLLAPLKFQPGKKTFFEYNYFEEVSWETATYDPDNCELHTEKVGSNEFSDVICAAYALYEFYADGTVPGLAESNGEIVDIDSCGGWLNQILGTSFSPNHRFRIWDIVETFALSDINNGYELHIDEHRIKNLIPQSDMNFVGGIDFTDVMYVLHGTKSLLTDRIEDGTYPADVLKCRILLENFLKGKHSKKILKLWDLLKMDYESRKNFQDKNLREIASTTLYMPARVFVYLAAELTKCSFWHLWKNLKDEVYHDEVTKQYSSFALQKHREIGRTVPIFSLPTSDYLRQNDYFTFYDTPDCLKGKPYYYLSDDDRMHWFDGTNEVILSTECEEWLIALAKQYKEILEDIANYDAENNDFFKYFLDLLYDINDYYKRIYPFKAMFYEFLENCSKKEYIAAVRLLEKLSKSDEYRTAGKVIEYAGSRSWCICSKNVIDNDARVKLKRYLSVMDNKLLRHKYFGF